MPDGAEPTRGNLPYPMPWCIETDRPTPNPGRRNPRVREERVDQDASLMERWLDEFTDKRTGGVCPPPMS